jgi:hypothetical protein
MARGSAAVATPRVRPPPDAAAAAMRRDRERGVNEFDITDVVGAVGGPKAIERAPHVDIATPGVRPARQEPWELLMDCRAAAAALTTAAAALEADRAERTRARAEGAAAAGSSSEDTEDDTFAALHAPMEALEKKLRLGPAPGRGSGAVGRGQLQPLVAQPEVLPTPATVETMDGDGDGPLSPSGLLSPGGPGCGAEWSALVRGSTARFARANAAL